MPKINPMQAAALNEPVTKVSVEKPQVAKSTTEKPAAAKVDATKPVAAKAPVKTPAKTVVKKVAKTPALVKEKVPKQKMERDSFTMPKSEYAQLYVLKDRLAKLGSPAKKSELLRAGIMQLNAMTDTALKLALSKVPTIKTGRPKKK